LNKMIFESLWPLIFATASIALCALAWYFYKTNLRRYFNREENNKYFAELMKDFTPLYNRVVEQQKISLFEELNAIQPNTLLKQKGILRILEIGAGAGANLDYYPSNCHLTVVEPNEFFKDMMLDKLQQFPGIHLENYYVAYAEDMQGIEDESFDVVVATIVACSVSNIQKVYKEVKRVLVSGGKFLYIDHVLDKPGTFLYFKQQILSRLGIWPLLFDGCHLNRNIDKEVEKCQFAQVLQKRFKIETSSFYIFPYIEAHVVGVAIKGQ